MDQLELIRQMAEILRQYAEEAGPCDHAANVCVCGINNLIFEADIALGKIKECAVCDGEGQFNVEEEDPDYGFQIVDFPCARCRCTGYVKNE